MVLTNPDGQMHKGMHTCTHMHQSDVVEAISCTPQAGWTKMTTYL